MMESLLQMNPNNRATVEDCLQSSLFDKFRVRALEDLEPDEIDLGYPEPHETIDDIQNTIMSIINTF